VDDPVGFPLRVLRGRAGSGTDEEMDFLKETDAPFRLPVALGYPDVVLGRTAEDLASSAARPVTLLGGPEEQERLGDKSVVEVGPRPPPRPRGLTGSGRRRPGPAPPPRGRRSRPARG